MLFEQSQRLIKAQVSSFLTSKSPSCNLMQKLSSTAWRRIACIVLHKILLLLLLCNPSFSSVLCRSSRLKAEQTLCTPSSWRSLQRTPGGVQCSKRVPFRRLWRTPGSSIRHQHQARPCLQVSSSLLDTPSNTAFSYLKRFAIGRLHDQNCSLLLIRHVTCYHVVGGRQHLPPNTKHAEGGIFMQFFSQMLISLLWKQHLELHRLNELTSRFFSRQRLTAPMQ